MNDCLISVGSNLGKSKQIVLDALKSLESHPHVSNLIVSELLQTRPIGGPENQPAFINGVARFETILEPSQLLQLLHETERNQGRQRRVRWDSRRLDLDLLLYGDQILIEPDCEVPHPRMSYRRFVLQPAAPIAGELIHPICQATIGGLLRCVEERPQSIQIFSSPSRQAALSEQLIRLELGPVLNYCDLGASESSMNSGEPAILMVFDLCDHEKRSFINQSRELLAQHQGPVLILQNESINQVVTEVSAAIETMKAL